jgi:hypothetical protein
MRVGDHDENRLADVLHDAVSEDRVVMDDRAAIVGARDVGYRVHRHHAGRSAHRIQVERSDAGMRLGRQAQRRMQCALQLGDIVGVGGLAQHVQFGRFVRPRKADAAPGGCLQFRSDGMVHGTSFQAP